LKHEKNRGFLQRGRMDIIACILSNAVGGSGKTRLIYKCNMSLSQFSIYVDRLTEGGLLRKYVNDKGKKIYETTKKGKDFLRDYEKIKKTLDQANM